MSLRAALLAAIALVSVSSLPASAEEGWVVDIAAKCKVWNFTGNPDVTYMWIQKCAGGVVEGNGILRIYYKDHPIGEYTGDIVAGRFQGQGVLRLQRGNNYDTYEGGWRDGAASGSGTLVDVEGNTYTGTWLGGCLRQTSSRARPPIKVGGTANTCW